MAVEEVEGVDAAGADVSEVVQHQHPDSGWLVSQPWAGHVSTREEGVEGHQRLDAQLRRSPRQRTGFQAHLAVPLCATAQPAGSDAVKVDAVPTVRLVHALRNPCVEVGCPHAEVAEASLVMAVANRGGGVDGLIFHSDRGSEYTAEACETACARHGMIQSMARIGSALDNAVAEAFNSTIKVEYIHRHHPHPRGGEDEHLELDHRVLQSTTTPQRLWRHVTHRLRAIRGRG